MDSKKLAAVTAAVFTYIKTGEEAACYAAAPLDETPRTAPAVPAALPFNAWGMAGRSELMQGRFMIQQRVFK